MLPGTSRTRTEHPDVGVLFLPLTILVQLLHLPGLVRLEPNVLNMVHIALSDILRVDLLRSHVNQFTSHTSHYLSRDLSGPLGPR